MQLPFPEYSWPFTQHAKVLEGSTTASLLAAASVFDGVIIDAQKIANILDQENVLTPNIRNGIASPWRDYQQVLPELGLTVSTRLSRKLHITTIGNLLLTGELSFQEVIRLQCLRYQYPNGQKEISPQFIERRICVKPGALCLKVLLALQDVGQKSELSLDECLNFLLPITANNRWQDAIDAIVYHRRNGGNLERGTDNQRRNIGDWFEFIGQSGWAKKESGNLSLTAEGLSQAGPILQAIEAEEARKFVLDDFSQAQRLRWFEYFGALPDWPEDLGGLFFKMGSSAFKGLDSNLTATGAQGIPGGPIELSELDLNAGFIRKPMTSNQTAEELAASIIEGLQKQQAATLLHEDIVRKAGRDMKSHGAEVFFDPNSFDLFARWPGGSETAFEAKTLSYKSAIPRIRGAVGQLLEYSYRYKMESNKSVEMGFVFNRSVPNDLIRQFLLEGIGANILVYENDGIRRDFCAASQLESHFF